MAEIFLRSSDGNDADDGSTWALAKATLQASLTAAGAGGTVWMDDNHSEILSAATTFGGGGTIANPIKIVCVLTDTTTPVSNYPASANIDTSSGIYNILFSTYAYWYGVNFKAGSLFGSVTSGIYCEFEKCFIDNGAAVAKFIWPSADAAHLKFIACDINGFYLATRQGCRITWLGGLWTNTGAVSFTAASLLNAHSESGAIVVAGCDLSLYLSSYRALIDIAIGVNDASPILIIANCLLASGIAYTYGSQTHRADEGNYKIDACHTADGFYAFYHPYYAGYVQEETTIKRQGGADYDGTNEYSAKFVTNANAKEALSYTREELPDIVVDATTPKKIKFHIAYDSAVLLQNDDIWIEAKVHDATNEALGNWVSTKAVGGVSIDRSSFTDVSGGETWDGTSGWTNPQIETVEVEISGGNGLVGLSVCAAKPSLTVYVDLNPDVEDA